MYRNRSRQKHLDPIVGTDNSQRSMEGNQNIEDLKNKLKDLNRSKHLATQRGNISKTWGDIKNNISGSTHRSSAVKQKFFSENNSLENVDTPLGSEERVKERYVLPENQELTHRSNIPRNLSKKLKRSLK